MSKPLDLEAIKNAAWRPYIGPVATRAVDDLVLEVERLTKRRDNIKAGFDALWDDKAELTAEVEKLKADREKLSKAVHGIIYADESESLKALKSEVERVTSDRDYFKTKYSELKGKIQAVANVS